LKKNNKIGFCLAYWGVNQNKNILHGINQKKYFTGGKSKMTYITGE